MSKTIDTSKGVEGLSNDDLLYLAQREHIPGVAGNMERELGPQLHDKVREQMQARRLVTAEIPNTGTTEVITQEELDHLRDRRAAAEEAEGDSTTTFKYDGVQAATEDVDTPYEDWKKADLSNEIDARNATGKNLRKGTVADMAAELNADDAADEEA